MSYADIYAEGYLIKSFYLSPKRSDLTIIVEGHRLYAHRFVLSRKSIIFRKMFFGEFKESKTTEIKLKETNLEAFKILLKYCYTEDLSPTDWSIGKDGPDISLILNVLKCAHLYEIRFLCRICQLKLIGFISIENVIDILDFGLLYRLKPILVFVRKFAKKHQDLLIDSQILLSCNTKTLIQFFIKSFRFEDQLVVIKLLMSVIRSAVGQTNGWSLNEFSDCIKLESLTIDDMRYILNNDPEAYPEMSLRRMKFYELTKRADEQEKDRLKAQIDAINRTTRRNPIHIGFDDWRAIQEVVQDFIDIDDGWNG